MYDCSPSAGATSVASSFDLGAASGPTIGNVAELVRSKNAGPFWLTLDVFLADDTYRLVAESPAVNDATISALYGAPVDSITFYRLPTIRLVKVWFPRPVSQGGIRDRDMHAGQQHVPLAQVQLCAPTSSPDWPSGTSRR